MKTLELLLIATLNACIPIEKNIEYIKSLETEEVFRDTNGSYILVKNQKGDCFIDFEPNLQYWYSERYQENIQTTQRLFKEYCYE